jgi:hypothetical protein
MSKDNKETIEVQGVKFSADEVHYVTIKRNGHTITIQNDDPQKPVMGFAGKEKDDK